MLLAAELVPSASCDVGPQSNAFCDARRPLHDSVVGEDEQTDSHIVAP